jgi:hypothetical protein
MAAGVMENDLLCLKGVDWLNCGRVRPIEEGRATCSDAADGGVRLLEQARVAPVAELPLEPKLEEVEAVLAMVSSRAERRVSRRPEDDLGARREFLE